MGTCKLENRKSKHRLMKRMKICKSRVRDKVGFSIEKNYSMILYSRYEIFGVKTRTGDQIALGKSV